MIKFWTSWKKYNTGKKTDIHRGIDMVNLNITSVMILTKLSIQDRLEKGFGKSLDISSPLRANRRDPGNPFTMEQKHSYDR